MWARTEAASSWVCLFVSLLGVFNPIPESRLILPDVIGEGAAGGLSFFDIYILLRGVRPLFIIRRASTIPSKQIIQ